LRLDSSATNIGRQFGVQDGALLGLGLVARSLIPFKMLLASTVIADQNRVYTIEVAYGDALKTDCDALILKHAQSFHGLDRIVAEALWGKVVLSTEIPEGLEVPEVGEVLRYATGQRIAPNAVVLVGVPPLRRFDYSDIREFARLGIAELDAGTNDIRHVVLTVHGVRNGLDEREAFIALLAGLLDSIRRKEWPESLQKVTIIESDRRRADRLATICKEVLPRKVASQLGNRQFAVPPDIASAGSGSRAKDYVFVAMPFDKELTDLFHYGISAAVRNAGYLCERADQSPFTGEVMNWIKAKITDASYVVAELTSANANVYLEVGYAWGRNVPTILLARDVSALKFDVHSNKCLTYGSIMDLEQKLTSELTRLRDNSAS
jgi:hypothetical protein